jgi:hypothetical protein
MGLNGRFNAARSQVLSSIRRLLERYCNQWPSRQRSKPHDPFTGNAGNFRDNGELSTLWATVVVYTAQSVRSVQVVDSHVGSEFARHSHDLFLSVENSYPPSFRNCELVLLNGLHHSRKKSDPFADHPTYRNRLSMVKSFPRNTEGFAVGNVELAHRQSPMGRLSWRPRLEFTSAFSDAAARLARRR